MKVHRVALRAALDARLLSAKDAADIAGIPYQTMAAILSRTLRSDEMGYVNIEPDTARRLRKLLDEVEPLLTVEVKPQGPRRLSDNIAGDSTLSDDERIASYHRQRRAQGT
jgi:hypothetical protein